MKSLVAKIILAATSVAAPVVAFSQINKTVTARQDMTLLTGPHLLSTTARPLSVESISSERVQPVTVMPTALEAAQQKRSKAEARLKQLRAERAASLASTQAEFETTSGAAPVKAPAAEHIRFDAQLPATPMELLRAAPLFKRE